MTIKRHLMHIKSNTPNKIPSSEDIEYGEIAINYNEGNEKIYLKNENDIIQSIQTDSQNDEKFSTKQELSGETQERLNSYIALNDAIITNHQDSLSKINQLSSTTETLQASAETLSNSISEYLPLTGGTISDRTLKENISLINEEDSKNSEYVSLKEFNFKEDEDKVKHYGVIAQEVQEAGLYNLVKEDKDGKLSVDYISLLILKISRLENKVKELDNQINPVF